MTTIERLMKSLVSPPGNGHRGSVDLQAALANERARSDRSGNPFAFVVIRVEGSSNGTLPRERAAQLLAEAVQDRTRGIDTVAYWGEDLAIILPYTSTESVNRLLQSIENMYTVRARDEVSGPSGIPDISFDIYSHPETVQEKAE